MRRIFPLLFLLLAGCSNAPVAGFWDNCFPSRAKDNPVPPPLIGPGIDVRPQPLDTIRPVPGPSPVPIPPPADLNP